MSTSPIDPSNNPDQSVTGPSSQQPAAPQPAAPPPEAAPAEAAPQMSKLRQFLGASATPEQVNQFLQGFLKFFNVMIQQSNEAHKRALEQMKRSIGG